MAAWIQIQDFFAFVSGNQFFGIPLDILAHSIGGAFILWFCLFCRLSFFTSSMIVLSAAVLKEIHDIHMIYNYAQNTAEIVKDITVTMLACVLLPLSNRFKPTYSNQKTNFRVYFP